MIRSCIALLLTIACLSSPAFAENGASNTAKGTEQLGKSASSNLQSTSSVTVTESGQGATAPGKAAGNAAFKTKNKFPPKNWNRGELPFGRGKKSESQ